MEAFNLFPGPAARRPATTEALWLRSGSALCASKDLTFGGRGESAGAMGGAGGDGDVWAGQWEH